MYVLKHYFFKSLIKLVCSQEPKQKPFVLILKCLICYIYNQRFCDTDQGSCDSHPVNYARNVEFSLQKVAKNVHQNSFKSVQKEFSKNVFTFLGD